MLTKLIAYKSGFSMSFKLRTTRKTLSRSVAVTSITLALLTACGGGSTDPAVVAADFNAYGIKATINGQNVTIDLSGLGNCATNIENMVVGINANGASISPDPRTPRDYTNPVAFTLTAPDGTKATYTVTVKGAACLTPTPAPTPAPAPAPAPVPITVPACTAAAIGSTGYSLVFKGCSAANVAEYYDKTECVRDNASGLIWQGQTAAGTGLRANDQYKTNYDSTTALQKWRGTNSGPGGALDPVNDFIAPTLAEVNASTNSIGFKNAVNATNLCGSGAWRLPTKDELIGIVKPTEYPTIDNAWFPNTMDWYYWTSSPLAGYAHIARSVHFFDGYASYELRDFSGYGYSVLVRLVR